MNVDTMRFIDYYIGIPLTFVLTLFRKIVDYVYKPKCMFESKRVLFIELSEMGSTILVDPVIRYFVKNYYIEPYFVIFEKNEPSLRILNTIPKENTFTIRSQNFLELAIDTIKFIFWCRLKGIDTVIDLELFSRYTAILSYLSGAKKRVGFYKFTSEGLYRGDLQTHNVLYNPYLHITKNYYSLAYSAVYNSHRNKIIKENFNKKSSMLVEDCKTRYINNGINAEEISKIDGTSFRNDEIVGCCEIGVDVYCEGDFSVNYISDKIVYRYDYVEIPFSKTLIPEEIMKISKVMYTDIQISEMKDRIRKEAFKNMDFAKDKLVIINANASELLPLRRWPKEYYIELIRLILYNHSNAYVLLTGTESEYGYLQTIEDAFRGTDVHIRIKNYAGRTKITDLPLLYTISSLMVTNDSGPAHFAAVTDLPTYVIFGPETPVLYKSLGNTTPIYIGLACSPCVSAYNHRKSPCKNNKCLKDIRPEMVYKLILDHLEK